MDDPQLLQIKYYTTVLYYTVLLVSLFGPNGVENLQQYFFEFSTAFGTNRFVNGFAVLFHVGGLDIGKDTLRANDR